MLAPALLNLAVLPLLTGRTSEASASGIGLVAMWVFAGAAYAIARWAHLDVGMHAPKRRDVLVAVCLGIVLMLVVPLLSVLGSVLAPESGLASRGSLGVVIAGVVTAAVTEEVLFRGVGITVLQRAGVPVWFAALVSLFAFALVHVGSWPLPHVLFVVLPLGAALTWCYVRFRNLPGVIVAHAIVDAPLVVLALAG